MANNNQDKAKKAAAERASVNKAPAPAVHLGTRLERRQAREENGEKIQHVLIKKVGRAFDPHQTYLPHTSAQAIPEGYALVLSDTFGYRGYRAPVTQTECIALAGLWNNEVVRERNRQQGKQEHEGIKPSKAPLSMLRSLLLPPKPVVVPVRQVQVQPIQAPAQATPAG